MARQFRTKYGDDFQSQPMLKARLYFSPDLFVQVYRNERFDTAHLVLLYGGRRIYARDQLSGRWHRHTGATANTLDTSAGGQRFVQLSEFLEKVEAILAAMGLP